MRKKDFRTLICLIDEAQRMIIDIVHKDQTSLIKLRRIGLRLEQIADILFDYEPMR